MGGGGLEMLGGSHPKAGAPIAKRHQGASKLAKRSGKELQMLLRSRRLEGGEMPGAIH